MGKIKPLYENCLVSCVIVADTHIDVKHPMPFIPKMFLKRALKDTKKSVIRQSAFITLGDTTSKGVKENWELAEECFAKYPDPADKILLALGNHDTWNDDGFSAAIEEYFKATEIICGRRYEKQYFSADIKGYKFIFLGSMDDVGCGATFGDEQIKWFEEELKSGTVDNKPVFVINHQSINQRHGLPTTGTAEHKPDLDPFEDGIGAESELVENILAQYKNVFYFSGHSHMGFCGENSLKNNGYTSFEEYRGMHLFNLPSLACGNHSGEDNRTCDGVVLEIYSDKVLIRPRDFFRRKWIKTFTVAEGRTHYEKGIEQ